MYKSNGVFKLIRKSKTYTKLRNYRPKLNWQLSYPYSSSSQDNEIFPLERIRNIGISAHIDSGKTTLTERILFYTGKIQEMHEVRGKDGVGAVMDSMELERQRGITIQSAATYTLWKDINVNIIDTPGHIDFTVEVERALRVLDGAILVLCSVGGVQSQSITVDRQMKRYSIPCLAFINKLDRSAANPYKVFEQIRSKLRHNAGLMQIPIGLQAGHKGVVELLEERAAYFEGEFGETIRYDEIPPEMRQEASEWRAELIEHVSNADDAVGELFLEEKTPSVDELRAGIRRACLRRTFTPVYLGTALKNKGVQLLLDAVLRYLPNPGEVQNQALVTHADGREGKLPLCSSRTSASLFVGLAFKLEAGKYGQLTYVRVYQGGIQKGDVIFNTRTQKKIRVTRLGQMHSNQMKDISAAYSGDICALFGVDCASGDTFTTDFKRNISMESMFVPEPVISMSIAPTHDKDVAKFSKGINRFTKEDPTYKIQWDEDAQQTLARGMGELHLEIYAQRMEREYGVPVTMGKPRVAFRETLLEPYNFDYLHKRQTGGAGQFGRVIGVLEPLPREDYTKLEFVDNTVGTDVPKILVPGIKKGFLLSCKNGQYTGNEVSGVRFRLRDGRHHIVDSSEYAFQLAAYGAMLDAFDEASWQVIEPIMLAEVSAPSEFSTDVLSLLNKRGGSVTDSDIGAEWCVIQFEVPLSSMFKFTSMLRAATQGKGEFTMEFLRYSPVSEALENELIADYEERTKQEESADGKKKKKSKK